MIEKLEGRLLGFEALRMFSNPNGFQNTPEKSNNFYFMNYFVNTHSLPHSVFVQLLRIHCKWQFIKTRSKLVTLDNNAVEASNHALVNNVGKYL